MNQLRALIQFPHQDWMSAYDSMGGDVMAVAVLHKDPFEPVLVSPQSVPLNVSIEQMDLIYDILEVSCADSRFVQKAFTAIMKVLAAQPVMPPTISSLEPNTAVIGSGSLSVKVTGTKFTSASQVIFGGAVVGSVFVSDTELTATVDVPASGTTREIQVFVLNENGVVSAPSLFHLTEEVTPQNPEPTEPSEPSTKTYSGTKRLEKK